MFSQDRDDLLIMIQPVSDSFTKESTRMKAEGYGPLVNIDFILLTLPS